MDVWTRLTRALHDLPRAPQPGSGRVGAVLVLLSDPDRSGDLELVYTRRRADLSSHPGQIAFPGGRVEPAEPVEQAAVREAAEEVGLRPSSVDVLGRLPPFFIPPSAYWLVPVVSRWRAPHPLVAAEAEVAAVLRIRVSWLLDGARWRVTRRPPTGAAWAWQLDERHLLWGATAAVTVALLDILSPGWNSGVDPGALPVEREASPWEAPERGADGAPDIASARLP
ncbi:MAG TPA: CoA pyrophosphatase [Egibacteraceae bacterium]|jgi:8-oxo-dGTP pyrophosphatase MutT (NUDIX family)|nr:CoA pyrophosphatase [Egibacteraceae bacterium]